MSVSVGGSGSVSVSVSGGIGPSIIVNGTSTAVVGSLGINPFVAGQNVTITTTGGAITILAANPRVYSVQGRTGTVTIQAVDIGAAAADHTHTTTSIPELVSTIRSQSMVVSVQGKAGTVTLTAADVTAASLTHTHSTTSITGFTAAIAAYQSVSSVLGRTGAVQITSADIIALGAASATHTHSTTSISGFTAAVAAAAPVTSVNGQTGAVTVSVSGLPSQTGASGKYLTSNGSVASWGARYGVVNGVLTAGANITLTPDANAGTIQIAAASGSGNLGLESSNGASTIYLFEESHKHQVVSPGNSNTTVYMPYANAVGSSFEFLIKRAGSGTGHVIVMLSSTQLADLTGSQWAYFANNGTDWYLVANG